MPTAKRSAKPTRSLDARLSRFLAHAYRNAPAVKQMFDQVGVKPTLIKTVADLERVPILRKDALVQMQKEHPPFGGFVTSRAQKNLRHIFQSPGPLYEPDAGDTERAQVSATVFKQVGFAKGDVVLNTLSYHLVPAGMMLDNGLTRIGATVVPSGVGQTELQVKLLQDLGITGYVGTPSFLLTILRKAEELGVNVRAQLALRKAVFFAEPYPPSLRQQFESGYGLRTTDVYATADVGFIAYGCEAGTGWHVADGIIVEIADPTTGGRVARDAQGEVIVTTFNAAYPLIRFGTGDLSAFALERCACGRKSPKLVGWLGRAGEAVKVRGMFVHPNQLRQAAAKFPSITKIQGI
ncbi:MAG: AMP-binding protein, partial [Chloroflexota bacterium]